MVCLVAEAAVFNRSGHALLGMWRGRDAVATNGRVRLSEEAAVGEEPLPGRRGALPRGQTKGRRDLALSSMRHGRDVEVAAAVILEGRGAACRGCRRRLRAKASPWPRRRATSAMITNHWPRLPGGGRNGVAARCRVELVPCRPSPPRPMRADDAAGIDGVAGAHSPRRRRKDRKRATRPARVGIGQAGDGMVAMIQIAVDAALATASNSLDRFSSGAAGHARALPERPTRSTSSGEVHVGGQRVGQRADLAAAMALGWPVIENGPCPAGRSGRSADGS